MLSEVSYIYFSILIDLAKRCNINSITSSKYSFIKEIVI